MRKKDFMCERLWHFIMRLGNYAVLETPAIELRRSKLLCRKFQKAFDYLRPRSCSLQDIFSWRVFERELGFVPACVPERCSPWPSQLSHPSCRVSSNSSSSGLVDAREISTAATRNNGRIAKRAPHVVIYISISCRLKWISAYAREEEVEIDWPREYW